MGDASGSQDVPDPARVSGTPSGVVSGIPMCIGIWARAVTANKKKSAAMAIGALTLPPSFFPLPFTIDPVSPRRE
jgi:hypothetical protein